MTVLIPIDTNEFLVNSTLAGDQTDPWVSDLSDGGFVVAWQSNDGDEGGIYSHRFNGAGTRVGTMETQINVDTSSGQFDASVATLANGNYIVVFSSDQSSSGGVQIVGRLFDGSTGDPIQIGSGDDASNEEFEINAAAESGFQGAANVTALMGGGFVVTWQSADGAPNNTETYARLFNADGTPVADQFKVNSADADQQINPQVAPLTNGGFVVAWVDSGAAQFSDTTVDGVFVQLYTADGTASGGATVSTSVSAGTSSGDEHVSVAGLSNGGFVVVWNGLGDDMDDATSVGVFGQRFDADGLSVGTAFTVNETVAGTQNEGSVVALSDGGFVVTWTSADAGSGTTGVYARRYDSEGTAGEVLPINTTTAGDQDTARAAVLSDGNLVVVWESSGQEGGAGATSTGIYARRIEVSDTIFGTAGNDTMLDGTEDDDVIDGLAGDDMIDGMGGDDILIGGAGMDTLDGGADDDTASYHNSDSGVTVNLGTGLHSGGHADGDTLLNIENLVGSDHNDDLTGDGRDNVIEGGAGADGLDGGGGTGDTVSYANSDAAVTVNLLAGEASGGHAQSDMISNFENVIGSDHGDTLNGSDGVNILRGGDGDDTLTGAGGADELDGGGGTGDTASYTVSGEGVTVSLVSGVVGSGGDAEGDTLENIENLAGSTFNDTLTGDEGVNELTGGTGDDILIGGAGADVLTGGEGGETDGDTANYSASTMGVTVDLGSVDNSDPMNPIVIAGTGTGGHAEGDSLMGIENIIGSATGANTLTGDANANELTGGAMGDTLTGGAGGDTLTGGGGADTFMYSGAFDGDEITDFSVADGDMIDLGLASGSEITFDDLTITDDDTDTTIMWDPDNDGTSEMLTLRGVGDSGMLTEAHFVGARSGPVLNPVTGTEVGDDLMGTAAADQMLGLGGDDTLFGSADADRLDGGTDGTDPDSIGDTADYSASTMGVTVSLVTDDDASLMGTADEGYSVEGVGGDADGDRLIRIENLTGSGHADTLTGDDNDNVLDGGAGNDTLTGGGGGDTLTGGDGADTFRFSAFEGDTIMDFENDTDRIEITASGVTFSDLAIVQNTIDPGAPTERLDTMITWNTGTLMLRGFDNVADPANPLLTADDFTFNTSITGTAGDDPNLMGTADDDLMLGLGGNDTLHGSAGADRLDGGDHAARTIVALVGGDTADYSASTMGVTVNLVTDGTATGEDAGYSAEGSGGDAAGDRLINIENLRGSDVATAAAGSFDDQLTGDDGDNILEGGAGRDMLTGGGHDTLAATGFNWGGGDAASYESSDAGVTVDLSLTTAQTSAGHASGDVLAGIESIIGSGMNDTLTGDGGINWLAGGMGDDTLIGGAGADRLIGGAGTDTVDYSASDAGVIVDLDPTSSVSGGHAAGDSLSGIENIIGSDVATADGTSGSEYDDRLSGVSTANVLMGGLGRDLLQGGGGGDTLDGGGGIDTVSYSISATGVTVSLVVDDMAPAGLEGYSERGEGGAADDRLRNIENLIGSGEVDTLTGDDDANRLEGGAGADTLTGGGGMDTFVYSGAFDGDTIADFSVADGDMIDLGLASGSEIMFDDLDITDDGTDTTIEWDPDNDGTSERLTLRGIDDSSTLTSASFVGVMEAGPGPTPDPDPMPDPNPMPGPITGTAGDDTNLMGTDDPDVMMGLAGDDTLLGSAGADRLDGGDDTDTVDYSGSVAGVTVSLVPDVRGIGGDAAGDMLRNIENIIGSNVATAAVGSFDDRLTGNGEDNRLEGREGRDRLDGGDGDDELRGGDGEDELRGGAGDDRINGGADADVIDGGPDDGRGDGVGDTVLYWNNPNPTVGGVTVSLVPGASNSGGHAEGDELTDIENVGGSRGADELTGNDLDNRLVGGGGGDTLIGGDGNDRLFGGNDDDVLIGGDGDDRLGGGEGADTLFGGNRNAGGTAGTDTGTDTVVYWGYKVRVAPNDPNSDFLPLGVTVDLNMQGMNPQGMLMRQADNRADGSSNGHAAGDMLVGIENVGGSQGNDTLIGDPEDNALVGGGGNDTLIGGAGADILTGGAGTDTASYAGSMEGVEVDLARGRVSGGDAQGDTLRGIENLTGSNIAAATGEEGNEFDDRLTGDGNANRLEGGEGRDRLEGGAGDDRLDGGDDNDELYGGDDNDTLTGGAGDDRLGGGAGADTLDGGDHDTTADGEGDTAVYWSSDVGVTVSLVTDASITDTMDMFHGYSVAGMGGHAAGDRLINIENVGGSSMDDVLTGNDEANTLVGGGGADTLTGGGGNDTLNGGLDDDTLDGGDDNDTLIGGAGSDMLNGGGGDDDTASYASSNAGVMVSLVPGATNNTGGHAQGDTLTGIENLIGSDHGDTLTGDDMVNTLDGGAGNDILTGGAGADILTGGMGSDTASYEGSDAGVTVDLSAGTGTDGHAQSDMLAGIENLIGSGMADTLIGDDGANTLDGGAGADTLDGGAGADRLTGGAGADIFRFSAFENDRVTDFVSGTDMVMIYQPGVVFSDLDIATSGGNTTVTWNGGMLTLEGVSRVTAADFDFRVADPVIETGTAVGETLEGDAGNDMLDGADGDDTLIGLAGADMLIGGDGGETDGDTASYARSNAGVTVSLVAGVSGIGGHAQGDTLTGIENLIGSDHGDTLIGEGAANRLDGGGGADTLIGGMGGDRLNGGDGIDTASYVGSDMGVIIDLEADTASRGHAEGDMLDDIENLTGSDHDDMLTGTSAANTLIGGGDADTIVGGGGADTLTGDGEDVMDADRGADIFRFSGSTGFAGATITDFQAGTDMIEIEATRVSIADLTIAASGSDTTVAWDHDGDGTPTFLTLMGVPLSSLGTTNAERMAYFEGLIPLVDGTDDPESVTGTAGAGDEHLRGQGNTDSLAGLDGADRLDGGAGTDTADYSASDAGVTVSLVAGASNTGGHAEGDVLTGIENILGSGHDDTLTGDGSDNVIIGGEGDDAIDGGGGTDTASYAGSDMGVEVDLATDTASGGHAEGDDLDNIENLVGSDHGDTLTGGSGANTLDGGADDDTLDGGEGADTLTGGAGADTFQFSAFENDTITDFEDGEDMIEITVLGVMFSDLTVGGGNGSNVTVTWEGGVLTLEGVTDRSTITAADFEFNTAIAMDFDGTPNDDVRDGGAANDMLSGQGGDDTLRGLGGADTLNGGDGDDTLVGGEGGDTLTGGEGDEDGGGDTASYEGSNAGVTVSLVAGVRGIGGHAEGDTLTEIENLTGSSHDDMLTGDGETNALEGEGGDDTLDGGAGVDLLQGGADDDILIGGAGADVLEGGEGTDTASYAGAGEAVTVSLLDGEGTAGDAMNDSLMDIENLTGSDHNDTLTGDLGANTIDGGAGMDTIEGGAGADTLTGGAGVDNFVFSDFQNDTITDFEIGTDTITFQRGITFADLTIGEAGDDATVTWEGGTLTLTGVDHAALMMASASFTFGVPTGIMPMGGSADDVLRGAAGNDDLQGAGGDDVLYGFAGADMLTGGADTDTASYEGSNAGVTVSLITNMGMDGHAEGDELTGIENLIGSDHDDTLTGDSVANVLEGGGGGDMLDGSSGNDTLVGGDGDDTLEGGTGMDRLDGGEGTDTATYITEQTNGVTVTLVEDRTLRGTADEGYSMEGMGNDAAGDRLRDIENITGSMFGDDLTGDGEDNILIGGMGFDTLRGGVGDDTLEGGADGDTLIGGLGADTLRGGDGIDIVSYEDSNEAVIINLSATAPGGRASGGHATGDMLFDIENVIGSRDHNDILTGDDGTNVLEGRGGDDTLDGGAGGDELDGGAGIDTVSYANSNAAVEANLSLHTDPMETDGTAFGGHAEGDWFDGIENLIGSSMDDVLTGDDEANILIGGMGGDRLDGGAGIDTADYSASTMGVTVSLVTDVTATGDDAGHSVEGSDGHAEGDRLRNIENLVGSSMNDVLTGDGVANTLDGGDGDDTLAGGAGSDTLIGGLGDDTVDYTASDAVVMVSLAGGPAFGGHAEGDTLIAVENLTGSDMNDTLIGNNEGNTLVGGAGEDRLQGGKGGDTLTGGGMTNDSSRDTFVFAEFEDDTITDFEDGTDMIEIQGAMSFDDLNVRDAGGDTVVEWNGGMLTLEGHADENTITAEDFMFVGDPTPAPSQSVDFLINTETTNDQEAPSVATLSGGGFVVVWQSTNQDASDGNPGIYGQRYDSSGMAVGEEFLVNTTTDGQQTAPSVAALQDDGFVVTWQSFQPVPGLPAGSWDIYSRRYGEMADPADASSTIFGPLGQETQVNVTVTLNQMAPSVASFADGSFVVTWHGTGHPSNSMEAFGNLGVYGARFNDSGSIVGGEFPVNTTTDLAQSNPSVAALEDGSGNLSGAFVIVWGSDEDNDGNRDIHLQRYDSSGDPIQRSETDMDGNTVMVNDEVLVNAHTLGSQTAASVAGLSNGAFVVVWQSDGQDGSGTGIYGQLFSTDGTKDGGEFRVSTGTEGDQSDPSVTVLRDGSFVVTWTSGDDDEDGVYGQLYRADGMREGEEFLVNATSVAAQDNPSVAAVGDAPTEEGDSVGFVVAWESEVQDGDDEGIYGQIFTFDEYTIV